MTKKSSEINLKFAIGIVSFKSEQRILANLRKIRRLSPLNFPKLYLFFNSVPGSKTVKELKNRFPNSMMTQSEKNIGPGGARDYLIRNAKEEFILLIDDDSYPISRDWTVALNEDVFRFRDASIITYPLYEYGRLQLQGKDGNSVVSFCAAASLVKKATYVQLKGFEELKNAYGMEEEDLSLQLLDKGFIIRSSEAVSFAHDAKVQKHADPERVASTVANQIILGVLRYPLLFMPLIIYKVCSRITYNLLQRRTSGNFTGLVLGLRWVLKNWHIRKPVKTITVLKKYVYPRINDRVSCSKK